MLFRDISLLLFPKIPRLLQKRKHPKHLALTHAVAEHVAIQRCVLWSTPGRWFLSCLASWESTEQNAGTTTLLEIWWGSHLCQCVWPICKWCSHVVDVVFNCLQRAASYWIQTLIFSRKWGIFVKCVNLLAPTNNLWSPEERSVCHQVTAKSFYLIIKSHQTIILKFIKRIQLYLFHL